MKTSPSKPQSYRDAEKAAPIHEASCLINTLLQLGVYQDKQSEKPFQRFLKLSCQDGTEKKGKGAV